MVAVHNTHVVFKTSLEFVANCLVVEDGFRKSRILFQGRNWRIGTKNREVRVRRRRERERAQRAAETAEERERRLRKPRA